MMLATFFVASLAGSTSVSAVPGPDDLKHSANWNGSVISYNATDYTGPVTARNNDPSTLPQGTIYFYTFDATSSTKTTGYLISFKKGTNLSKATSATYQTGDYDINSGRFSNLSPPETIEVDASTYGSAAAVQATSCDVDGIGWLVCPVSNWIANGIDALYGVLTNFLTVTPLTTSNGSLYTAWKFALNIANISFILGFLVIIYYYLAGTVEGKYTIRKIVPRVVIVAILVNVSYWVCAVAVDISNILGYSVQEMFTTLRDQLGAANSAADDIGWKAVTAVALGGGGAAYAGLAGIAGATALGGTSMSLLLMAALVPVLFAIFVAVAVLAARQALITIFIIISPLAFAMYLLPNTEEWFGRWRKLFVSMLIMFPAFSAIFGGSQLAGVIIIQNAPNSPYGLAIVILGLVVQAIPLFITPFLIRLSSGLLGTIAGLANDRSKGIFDRTQNMLRDRAEDQKARVMKNQPHRANLWRRAGNHYGMSKHNRERLRAARMAQAEANYDRTRRGYRAYEEGRLGEDQKEAAKNANEKQLQKRISGNYDYSDLSRRERASPLHAMRQENKYADWRERLHESHADSVGADIMKQKIHDEGERHVRKDIATGSDSYNRALRGMQQQSVADKGVAELYKGRVEAQGEKQFRKEVADSRELTRVVKDSYHDKKMAESYQTIVDKAAEKSWSNRVRNDDATQTLYLRAKRNEDGAELAEQQVKEFVQNVRTQGGTAPGVAASAIGYADNIKTIYTETDISKNAEAAAQKLEQIELAKAYEGNAQLRRRAGGIGGEAAANLVFAKAKQTIINNQIEGTKAEKSILTQTDSSELFAGMDDPTKSVEQLAAYAGTIAERGYHADHVRLLDKVSRMYQDAEASGDAERIGVMKDVIQQVKADLSKDAFGISDTDRTLLSEGRYNTNIYESTRDRIMTNLSVEAMSQLDPDDMYLLYEMDQKGFLTQEQHDKIVETYNKWKVHEVLGPKLKDKQRNVYERMIDPTIRGVWNDNKEPPRDLYHVEDGIKLTRPSRPYTP